MKLTFNVIVHGNDEIRWSEGPSEIGHSTAMGNTESPLSGPEVQAEQSTKLTSAPAIAVPTCFPYIHLLRLRFAVKFKR